MILFSISILSSGLPNKIAVFGSSPVSQMPFIAINIAFKNYVSDTADDWLSGKRWMFSNWNCNKWFWVLTWATTEMRKWHQARDLDKQTRDPDFASTRCSNVLVLAINTWATLLNICESSQASSPTSMFSGLNGEKLAPTHTQNSPQNTHHVWHTPHIPVAPSPCK